MPDTDDPPDLSRLELGDELRVYYTSKRSGNEVDRKGELTHTNQTEDDTLYWVHTEQRSPLKHQYVVLGAAKLESGEEVVAAHSVTLAAESPNDGDPPAPGASYMVHFSADRMSLLGVVDRIMRDGWNINVNQSPNGVNL